ncbi:MAG: thiolase domain-containing protein [Deltaproteobacteria bacterium]|nr:thiolase domain-containing protein [Deltaproteobacteria bacterium]
MRLRPAEDFLLLTVFNMEKIYILGGAQTDFERNWFKEGKNFIGMMTEVANDALKDCSIDYEEIKRLNSDNAIGGFVANFGAELYLNQAHLNVFMDEVNDAFIGMPSIRYESACASGSAAIVSAIHQIGVTCDVGIVLGMEIMKSLSSSDGAKVLGAAAYFEREAVGRKYPFPELFGRLALDTVSKYSLDESEYMDNLAKISFKNYSNARRNENAQTRKWFMSYEHARNRGVEFNHLVGAGLGVSDCSQVTDGAAAIILASKKYAESYCKEMGMTIDELPYIAGYGHRNAPVSYSKKIEYAKDSDIIIPWTRQTIQDAYKMASVTVDDLDLIETHDCFTSSEYAAISCFGITKPGREFEAINDGVIFFDGKLPVNPSGGLIGGGHPVGATGVRMMLDLAKQVSNKADTYQIKNAKTAAMLNLGGSATSNFAFVVKR